MSLENEARVNKQISSMESHKEPKYLGAAIPLLSRHLLYGNPSLAEEVDGYRYLKTLSLQTGLQRPLAGDALEARWTKVGFYQRGDGAGDFDAAENFENWSKAVTVALAKRFSKPDARPLTKKQFVDDFFPFSSSREDAKYVLKKLKETYVLTEDVKFVPLIKERKGFILMDQAAWEVLLPHLPVLEVIIDKDDTDSEVLAIYRAIKDSTIEALNVGEKFFQRDRIRALAKKSKSGNNFSFKSLGIQASVEATPGSLGEQNLRITLDGQEKGRIGVNENNTFEVTGDLKPELPGSLKKAERVLVGEEGTHIEWNEVPEVARKIYFGIDFGSVSSRPEKINIAELELGESLSEVDREYDDDRYNSYRQSEHKPRRKYSEFLIEGSELSIHYPREYEIASELVGDTVQIHLKKDGWAYTLSIPSGLDSVALANQIKNKFSSLLSGIERELGRTQRNPGQGIDGDNIEHDIFNAIPKPIQKSPAEIRAELEEFGYTGRSEAREVLREKAILDKLIKSGSREEVDNQTTVLKDTLGKALHFNYKHATPDLVYFHPQSEEMLERKKLFRFLREFCFPNLSDEQVLGYEKNKPKPLEPRKLQLLDDDLDF